MEAAYVYADSGKTLRHFICGMAEGDDTDSGEYSFTGIETIAENAFYAPWNVKRVFFDAALATVKKEAFKDAGELEVFCCGKLLQNNSEDSIQNLEVNDMAKNSSQAFSVETAAFSGCTALHTVIFPKCGTLKIEKNAFAGCYVLRTVVALADEIKWTENPFKDCPQELVFVCYEHSGVEQFARENGYRYVYVQQ